MSAGPKDATLSGDGFRFYRWEPAEGGEATDVLSVTSIRKMCGEPFTLVNWQLANLADAALGTMKRTVVGPRGGISEKRLIQEYPCEFARLYDAAGGEIETGSQVKIDELRKWLRETADQPRNIAARRGTITHSAIEKNVPWDRIERPWVEAAFAELSPRDRKSAPGGVEDEDVAFIRNASRQYWNMRGDPRCRFIIIAREVQIFNLEHGYAGSADALVWFPPTDLPALTKLKASRDITLDYVKRIGGYLAVLDWKTAKDIHTDNVVQAHAYIAGEFIGAGGIVDHRLTDLLQATLVGGLIHIRPNGWGVYMFDFEPEVLRAFLGACAFARFLAKHPKPEAIFTRTFMGQAPDEESA